LISRKKLVQSFGLKRRTRNSKRGEFGLEFPFDPAELLESVSVHPEADISFYETVLWAIDDHAKPLRGKVSWSSMREQPPFQKPLPFAK
jgi:hypothetical protein